MRKSVNLIKLVLLAAIISLSACKNDKKSEAKEGVKETNKEDTERKKEDLNHVPGVLMTMHKETMTLLDIGMEKSENPKVKEYIENFQNELTVVMGKSEHVFQKSGLEVKDSKLSEVLKEKIKATEKQIKTLDSEKYDQQYMENISEYLFEQLGVVETELVPIKDNRELGEAVHLTMIAYKTYADHALKLEREMEASN
ncbi:MAG TPA: DUF4142 domain-containing protein [Flavobacteriaceae bacterium]|nr:DUF4142 domain-containing protein [Flavobacteriaceae bacterium]